MAVLHRFYCNSLHTGYFFMFLSSFRKEYQSVKRLNPDQDRHSVGPDVGPNCLQRLSADDKCPCQQEKSLSFNS